MMETVAVKILENFRDTLPRGHHDIPGVLRSIEVLTHAKVDDVVGRRKPLTFHRASLNGQHWAVDDETGLHFVVTRVRGWEDGKAVGPWEYEIEIDDDGRTRIEHGIMRFDSARARCNEHVWNRLTGADK